MKRLMYHILYLFMVFCFVACSEEGKEGLAKPFTDVREIRFVMHRGNNTETIHVVTDADEVRKIIGKIHIGKEQSFSKHIFLKTLVLVKSDGESVHMPFEGREERRSVRLASKQFKTDRKTIEFLNSYYNELTRQPTSNGRAIL